MHYAIIYISANECIRNSKCEFFKIRKRLRDATRLLLLKMPKED